MPRRRRSRARTLGEVTKKDFIAIADVLCRTNADVPIVRGLASYFKRENQRFHEGRFVAAANCYKKGSR